MGPDLLLPLNKEEKDELKKLSFKNDESITLENVRANLVFRVPRNYEFISLVDNLEKKNFLQRLENEIDIKNRKYRISEFAIDWIYNEFINV